MGVSLRSAHSPNDVDEVRRACRDIAAMLDQAQSVEQFRRGLAAQRHLWRTIRAGLASGDLPVPVADRADIRAEAAFVLDTCEAPGSPSDMQVEAFIAINRRLARLLAAVPRRPRADRAAPGRASAQEARPTVTAGWPV